MCLSYGKSVSSSVCPCKFHKLDKRALQELSSCSLCEFLSYPVRKLGQLPFYRRCVLVMENLFLLFGPHLSKAWWARFGSVELFFLLRVSLFCFWHILWENWDNFTKRHHYTACLEKKKHEAYLRTVLWRGWQPFPIWSETRRTTCQHRQSSEKREDNLSPFSRAFLLQGVTPLVTLQCSSVSLVVCLWTPHPL